MNKTYIAKKHKPMWFFVNAKGKTLGRLSTQIASILKNKNSIYYTPYQISESYIVVTNASQIQVSGQKKEQKMYRRHSGRPGGMKKETFAQLQRRIPEKIVEKAVRGMLPKNTLGRKLFTNLKVYPGPDHPHKAQKPVFLGQPYNLPSR